MPDGLAEAAKDIGSDLGEETEGFHEDGAPQPTPVKEFGIPHQSASESTEVSI